ncbi:hypothetical protein LDENG_00121120 [Lucifuga dentata]|nr:hypothetical protein LDENG_00121120 [Lucifuga dentata]
MGQLSLVLLLLLLLLLCAQAENFFEVKVQLGENATLNCSLQTDNIYWFRQMQSRRAPVLRTFSRKVSDAVFASADLRRKFSIMENKLQIHSVAAGDLRLYYCGRKHNQSMTFTDAFHLLSAGDIEQQPVSFILNIFLFLVTSLVLLCLKRGHTCQRSSPSPLTSESPEMLDAAQYEEIQMPPCSAPPPPAAHSTECIYYKAQLPQHTPLQA